MWTCILPHMSGRNAQPNTPRNRTRKSKTGNRRKIPEVPQCQMTPCQSNERRKGGRRRRQASRVETKDNNNTMLRNEEMTVETQVETMKATLQWKKSAPQPSKTKVEYGSRTHPIKNRGNRGSRTYTTAEQEMMLTSRRNCMSLP
jgi:hypothetical protein